MKKKVISLVTMGMMGAALLAPGGALAAQHQKFSDIKGHYAQKHIEAMAEKGIVSGTGMGKFSPNQKITKEHVEALLKKASGKEVKLAVNHRFAVAAAVVYAFDLTPDAGQLTDADVQAAVGKFTDKDMIPVEDVKQIAFLIKEGVLSGVSSTEFKPHDEITRSQVITILGRLTDKGKITLKHIGGGMKDKQGMNPDKMKAKKAEMGAMMAEMNTLLEQLKKEGKLTAEQLKLVEEMQKKMADHQAKMEHKMKESGMDMGQGAIKHQEAAAPNQGQNVVKQPSNTGNHSQHQG
ncbi:MAG: S-layer homology domain-containing protein [Thermincolia bacterium]